MLVQKLRPFSVQVHEEGHISVLLMGRSENATNARFPGEGGRFAWPRPRQRQERRATRLTSCCTLLAANERAVSHRASRGGLAHKQLRGEFQPFDSVWLLHAPRAADARFQRRGEWPPARAVPPCPPTPPPPPPSRRCARQHSSPPRHLHRDSLQITKGSQTGPCSPS